MGNKLTVINNHPDHRTKAGIVIKDHHSKDPNRSLLREYNKHETGKPSLTKKSKQMENELQKFEECVQEIPLEYSTTKRIQKTMSCWMVSGLHVLVVECDMTKITLLSKQK